MATVTHRAGKAEAALNNNLQLKRLVSAPMLTQLGQALSILSVSQHLRVQKQRINWKPESCLGERSKASAGKNFTAPINVSAACSLTH